MGILCIGNNNFIISTENPSSNTVILIYINPDTLIVQNKGEIIIFKDDFNYKL